jgi:threonine/homoserine/homoserine lactone efflux protein
MPMTRCASPAPPIWLSSPGALKPGGASPFQLLDLAPDSPRRLFAMGLLTSLLNPKTAALYLSLLPPFIDRASGDILAQTLTLGALQIAISVCFNTTSVLAAGTIAAFLVGRPLWARLQTEARHAHRVYETCRRRD